MLMDFESEEEVEKVLRNNRELMLYLLYGIILPSYLAAYSIVSVKMLSATTNCQTNIQSVDNLVSLILLQLVINSQVSAAGTLLHSVTYTL